MGWRCCRRAVAVGRRRPGRAGTGAAWRATGRRLRCRAAGRAGCPRSCRTPVGVSRRAWRMTWMRWPRSRTNSAHAARRHPGRRRPAARPDGGRLGGESAARGRPGSGGRLRVGCRPRAGPRCRWRRWSAPPSARPAAADRSPTGPTRGARSRSASREGGQVQRDRVHRWSPGQSARCGWWPGARSRRGSAAAGTRRLTRTRSPRRRRPGLAGLVGLARPGALGDLGGGEPEADRDVAGLEPGAADGLAGAAGRCRSCRPSSR